MTTILSHQEDLGPSMLDVKYEGLGSTGLVTTPLNMEPNLSECNVSHGGIARLYLGVITFIYMFRVWGLNMLMLVRGIVGRSDVNDVSKWGFPQAAIVAVSTGGPACASRL